MEEIVLEKGPEVEETIESINCDSQFRFRFLTILANRKKIRIFHDFDSGKLSQNRRFFDFDQNRPSTSNFVSRPIPAKYAGLIYYHTQVYSERDFLSVSKKQKKMS